MTNTIDITIKAPEPPEGYEIWTGEGVPPEPCYGLSGTRHWNLNPNPDWIPRPLAYAVPIAKPKPKSREAWVSEGVSGQLYLENHSPKMKLLSSCQRITLYEGRYDQEGVPTPEERLIEAVGDMVAMYHPNVGVDHYYRKVQSAYKAIQEMKGE